MFHQGQYLASPLVALSSDSHMSTFTAWPMIIFSENGKLVRFSSSVFHSQFIFKPATSNCHILKARQLWIFLSVELVIFKRWLPQSLGHGQNVIRFFVEHEWSLLQLLRKFSFPAEAPWVYCGVQWDSRIGPNWGGKRVKERQTDGHLDSQKAEICLYSLLEKKKKKP